MRISDWSSDVCSSDLIENNDMPDLGIPFKNDANPGRTTPPNVDRDNFYGRHNVDFRENVFDMATAQLEHDISSNVTVRNTTRYGKTLNHYLMTRPSFDNCDAGDGAPCSTEGPGVQFTRSDRARWRSSRSEEHTSELQSLMRISYAVFCLKKK